MEAVFAWRRKMGLDAWTEDDKPEGWEEYRKVRPKFEFQGPSGHPVTIERFGLFTTNTMVDDFTLEQWERFYAYDSEIVMMNRLRNASNELGREVSAGISVMDERGLGLGSRHGIPLLKLMSKIGTQNYPEILYKIVLVNAPWIFSSLFSLVKVFLDKDTLSKVIVASDVPEALVDMLGRGNMPVEFGGDHVGELAMPLLCHEEGLT